MAVRIKPLTCGNRPERPRHLKRRSRLAEANRKEADIARTIKGKTEPNRAAIYARVSDKSQDTGEDLHLRADGRDGSLLRG